MKFILELYIPAQTYDQIGTALESVGRELGRGDKPKVGDTAPLFSLEGQVGFWKVVGK